jgi:hypothetical protein
MILSSLDSSWQALHNSGFAITFGDYDFGSPEINFLFLGFISHKISNMDISHIQRLLWVPSSQLFLW